MRILNDATHEVGHRAARVFLSHADVAFVGIWEDPAAGTAARSGPVTDAAGFDIIVTDRTEAFDDLVARAAVEHIPIVIWGDAETLAEGRSTAPVIRGANVGSALTQALEHHPAADVSSSDTVLRAWTEPGAPLHNGHPIAFPEPVGMSWAQRRGSEEFVSFRDDQWGGAVLRVTGPESDRVIGAADHAAHLEALVLASAAFATISSPPENRVGSAASLGEQLMNSLTKVELDLAVWRSSV
ncbi:MAG: hypothetical protein ACR2N9_03820 [Acidimicrobiia bacterium]